MKTAGGQLKNRWQSANIKSATNSETESSNFVSIKPPTCLKKLCMYIQTAQGSYISTIGLLLSDLENRDIYGYSTEKRCGVWHEFGKSLLRIP